jgi:hypothetical protein
VRKGAKVRFRVSDVFLPAGEELREVSPEKDELEGVIVAFSDSGATRRAFAVIEVALKRTLIVPVEKVKSDE